MGIVNCRSIAGEFAEQAAKIIDARCHHAYGPPRVSRIRYSRGEFDFKRMKAMRCEQTGGVEVIRKAAKAQFLFCKKVVDKSAVGSCSRHYGEISNLVTVLQFAKRNCLRYTLDLLERGLHRIQGEAQMPGKGVCAAKRNNAESAGGCAIF